MLNLKIGVIAGAFKHMQSEGVAAYALRCDYNVKKGRDEPVVQNR